MTFKLITNGDSWTFGSEIIDPILINKYPNKSHLTEYDLIEENDSYRMVRIWPTYLANIMNSEVINLAYPGDDNGSILRRTLSYITHNFIKKNIPTDDIIVIIGWSSPERNSLWYDNGKVSYPLRIWPNHPIQHGEHRAAWEYYVSNLWNPEEYIRRFVFDALQFENFCVKYKIKFLQFNSFYQTTKTNIPEWPDLNISSEISKLKSDSYSFNISTSDQRRSENLDYLSLWNTIDPINFYYKDKPNNTFKSFIDNKRTDPYNKTWHPSPEAHMDWAEELHRYMTYNKII